MFETGRPPAAHVKDTEPAGGVPVPKLLRGRSVPDSSTSPPRMKLFYVGDNRSNVNWGRAASIALDQLLSGSFDITGRVTGDFFDLSSAPAGYVGTFLPARYYQFSPPVVL